MFEAQGQEVERWRTLVSKRDLELENLRVKIREQASFEVAVEDQVQEDKEMSGESLAKMEEEDMMTRSFKQEIDNMQVAIPRKFSELGSFKEKSVSDRFSQIDKFSAFNPSPVKVLLADQQDVGVQA